MVGRLPEGLPEGENECEGPAAGVQPCPPDDPLAGGYPCGDNL